METANDGDKKSYKALQRHKGILPCISRSNMAIELWHTMSAPPILLRHPKRAVWGKVPPNILIDFMGRMPCHAFKNLFQLRTGSGVLAICFQMKRDSEPKSLLQLEPAEGVLNKCPRAACLMLLLAVNPWLRSTRCYVSQVSLNPMESSMQNSSAIKRLNL